jgi:hypothetical protein
MLGAVEHDVTLLAAGHSEMSAWQCGVLWKLVSLSRVSVADCQFEWNAVVSW